MLDERQERRHFHKDRIAYLLLTPNQFEGCEAAGERGPRGLLDLIHQHSYVSGRLGELHIAQHGGTTICCREFGGYTLLLVEYENPDVDASEWDIELFRFAGDVTEDIFDESLRDEIGDASLSPSEWIEYFQDLQSDEPVVLLGTTMDWWWGAAPFEDPGQGGTGGPGAVPLPVENKSWLNNPFAEAPCYFALPNGFPETSGQGVTVAILDAAPKSQNLKDAYDNWAGDHPLIADLFANLQDTGNDLTGDLLDVHYAPQGLMAPLHGDLGLLKAAYTIPDHGTFVSGIVHAIAPEAKIHLFQVLNDLGAGSLCSITWGLEQVYRMSEASLVVNLSLTMSMPRDTETMDDDDLLKEPLEEYMQGSDPNVPTEQKNFIARMAFLLRAILETVKKSGPVIIAAAGNDGYANVLQDRSKARYPAAFDEVSGVGAHKTKQADVPLAPASYSNISDDPEKDGFILFGGDVTPDGINHPDDGPYDLTNQQGILGIYITDFPEDNTHNGKDSPNGWGRWSGTSFAAPILAGMLAILLGEGSNDPVADMKRYETPKHLPFPFHPQETCILTKQIPHP